MLLYIGCFWANILEGAGFLDGLLLILKITDVFINQVIKVPNAM